MVNGAPENDPNYREAERFNKKGYALVLVDARGSGASFGSRPYELAEDEVRDYGEIADWIVSQAWSNDRVGAYGVSYAGNTAEMLAVNGHPTVKAIAPLFNDFDNFGHLVFPGGLLCVGFLKDWGERVHDMDQNDICAIRNLEGAACDELRARIRGVKPVDSDRDGRMLAEAVREHGANTRVYEAALEYEFRDDPFGPAGVRDVGFKRSPAGHLREIGESGAAMLVRVGWQDAATVNGALGRFCTLRNPQ
jgi:putative CocE/NonD family hydrolase